VANSNRAAFYNRRFGFGVVFRRRADRVSGIKRRDVVRVSNAVDKVPRPRIINEHQNHVGIE
jgi:hypothetical protein